MDELYNLYSKKCITGTNESEMFSQFFNNDRLHVEEWFDAIAKEVDSKNNDKANKFREIGNTFYKEKKFNKSLKFYTKALCYAIFESESYGVILANRSAVFYMKEDYENCLKDINRFMGSDFPKNIKLKVLIRKIKCCSKMQLLDELKNAVTEAKEFLETTAVIIDKDKIQKEILTASLEKPSIIKLKSTSTSELPNLKDGPNKHFLYGSSAIRLEYNKIKGRHVVANKKLEPGDVLFVEKPFTFAPVFINEDKELPPDKCFNCLKTVIACVPCKYCIKCIYCNQKCRDDNWKEFHRWECIGMQINLWYHIGIAYPALRALVKGVKSGLNTLDGSYEDDTVTFGNECDNYEYFDKLVSNISKMKNVLPIIISATIVILYLKKKTNFFDWLTEQPTFTTKNVDKLIELCGGRLVKHIAQLQCNASVIFHEDFSTNSIPIACAIYPSISMMNHSCKPNIKMFYVRDTVIVEAAETIDANEEICNCYGIDYRYADWESRQEQCKNLYYFKCQCRICKLPPVHCV